MEVVKYGAFTMVWWLMSATVLLPLMLILKVNKTLSDRWFSWIYLKIARRNVGLHEQRKRAFELLKDHLKQRKRDASIPLEVLEIGAGGGDTLQHYPDNCNLTLLEKNSNFDTYLRENQNKYPHITYKRTVYEEAENMKTVADASMDVVVSAFVLCSVKDVRVALAEVKRVLKPGGILLFLDHVAFPSTEWAYTVQCLANPLWFTFFNGCYLNRDIAKDIHEAGFSDVYLENVVLKKQKLYLQPQICGIATK